MILSHYSVIVNTVAMYDATWTELLSFWPFLSSVFFVRFQTQVALSTPQKIQQSITIPYEYYARLPIKPLATVIESKEYGKSAASYSIHFSVAHLKLLRFKIFFCNDSFYCTEDYSAFPILLITLYISFSNVNKSNIYPPWQMPSHITEY